MKNSFTQMIKEKADYIKRKSKAPYIWGQRNISATL